MKRVLIAVLLTLVPFLVFADDTLTFTPPTSDYSMVFLGNLFGMVDGVLHGTGSQIMGAMFGVFNAAVLALGGMVIMYTLMVSTMNTAHEGQMLGQKWSSIWIPLRSTLGLALLMPKASGYCLMQIFVMWVVTQGVGAADKVWEAALGYLNRGGVIIQSQGNQGSELLDAINKKAPIPHGAFTILTGQVCMFALQKKLEMIRQTLINNPHSTCFPPPSKSGSQTESASPLVTCTTAVPDFLSSVNFVDFQRSQTTSSQEPPSFTLKMPNFPSANDYSKLNGKCGQVTWNAVAKPPGPLDSGGGDLNHLMNAIDAQKLDASLSSNDMETFKYSRAIAIQQMYVDLSSVAQAMVNNDPNMNSKSNSSTKDNFSSIAVEQYGVPYTGMGSICTSTSTTAPPCTTWGTDDNSTAGVLFNGTEFTGALMDYNAVMMPTLNFLHEAQNAFYAVGERSFIAQANAQGWMMAGSYFFDLVLLNGSAVTASPTQDTNSGLESSEPLEMKNFTQPDDANYKVINSFLDDDTALMEIANLINGGHITTKSQPTPTNPSQTPPALTNTSERSLISGPQSSSVWAFVNNSLMVSLPGQPGVNSLSFANRIHVTPGSKMYYLPYQNFGCGTVKTFVFSFCLGQMLGDIFYNSIIVTVYNALIFFLQQIIEQVIMAFIMIPLQGLTGIFKEGVETISKPGVNPIIALAEMGANYINFAGNLWIELMNLSIITVLVPLFGIFIFAMFAFVLPLLFAWVGIMVSVGFTTAYYIPVLPYMIFTFGSIAWLISVIEAMVAAPIVALGVTHPEGHDAFGKGEAAIMLLMNVFLRPAMMIIGYISAIALSYVSVWILNAGFDHAISFIQTGNKHSSSSPVGFDYHYRSINALGTVDAPGSGSGGYHDWAGVYAYFFSILIYTTMYLTVVQKAFTLISYLPDKVLRWIGGNPESLGGESAQWGDEMVKGKIGEAASKTGDSQGQMSKQLAGVAQKAIGAANKKTQKAAGGGSAGFSGGAPATPK